MKYKKLFLAGVLLSGSLLAACGKEEAEKEEPEIVAEEDEEVEYYEDNEEENEIENEKKKENNEKEAEEKLPFKDRVKYDKVFKTSIGEEIPINNGMGIKAEIKSITVSSLENPPKFLGERELEEKELKDLKIFLLATEKEGKKKAGKEFDKNAVYEMKVKFVTGEEKIYLLDRNNELRVNYIKEKGTNEAYKTNDYFKEEYNYAFYETEDFEKYIELKRNNEKQTIYREADDLD